MFNFYALPLKRVLCIIIISVLLWVNLGVLFNGKKINEIWKKINVSMFILSLLLILKMTLFGRKIGDRELELLPFYTVSYNDEAIRTLLMNVVLFLPFGLTVPYVLYKIKKQWHRWVICIALGLGISLGIEIIQYYFKLGIAETDDVLCNTFGCILGVSADILASIVRKYKGINI